MWLVIPLSLALAFALFTAQPVYAFVHAHPEMVLAVVAAVLFAAGLRKGIKRGVIQAALWVAAVFLMQKFSPIVDRVKIGYYNVINATAH